MTPESDTAMGPKMTIVGTVVVKNVDDLRPVIVPLIGRILEFDYVGTGGDDEPYPRQTRWMPARKHDAELGMAAAYWFPEEDIVELNDTGK